MRKQNKVSYIRAHSQFFRQDCPRQVHSAMVLPIVRVVSRIQASQICRFRDCADGGMGPRALSKRLTLYLCLAHHHNVGCGRQGQALPQGSIILQNASINGWPWPAFSKYVAHQYTSVRTGLDVIQALECAAEPIPLLNPSEDKPIFAYHMNVLILPCCV